MKKNEKTIRKSGCNDIYVDVHWSVAYTVRIPAHDWLFSPP